jgi:hypothetical protein
MWRFSTLEVDDMVKKRLGAIVLAAAVGILAAIAVVVLATNGDDDATTPTEEPTSVTRPAMDVAQRFVEAVAAFDADAALSHVEAGTDLTGVITSVGAQNVAGSRREFRQFVSLLQALQYEQILDSCDELGSSDAGSTVRCAFDFHLFGSHELGLGPFEGSTFTLTIADGSIVKASMVWGVDEFSVQVWDPFADWVSTTHPADVAVMYTDQTRSGVSVTEDAVPLWDRRIDEYLREERHRNQRRVSLWLLTRSAK